MPAPTKMRAALKDGVADVRALLAHEMESGQRRDAAGKLVAAWFIRDVVATLNGRTVMKAHWGPAISKNPFLTVKVKAKAGDKLVISWTDSRGEQRTDETVVA